MYFSIILKGFNNHVLNPSFPYTINQNNQYPLAANIPKTFSIPPINYIKINLSHPHIYKEPFHVTPKGHFLSVELDSLITLVFQLYLYFLILVLQTL